MAQDLYLILNRQAGLVKVGISANVPNRKADLERTCGVELEIIATFQVEHASYCERRIHRGFAAYRQRGEWFEASPFLLILALETDVLGALVRYDPRGVDVLTLASLLRDPKIERAGSVTRDEVIELFSAAATLNWKRRRNVPRAALAHWITGCLRRRVAVSERVIASDRELVSWVALRAQALPPRQENR